ncbi:MAG: hypothetical protein WCK32_02675 [Chlorobiaceae bacterium]
MQKTVFIIGAGASAEVGLPTGIELKKQISESLNICYNNIGTLINGDKIIANTINIECKKSNTLPLIKKEMEEYEAIFKTIRKHLPLSPSIDNFIDSKRDDHRISLCGKIAIVKHILDAERKSLLFIENNIDGNLNYEAIEKTWYGKFFHLISQSSDINEAKQKLSRSSYIIFNYDRCFEHFMYNGLKDFYKLNDEEAFDFIDTLNIIHPYGDVGELPFTRKNDTVCFGANITDPNQLLSLSNRIRTFTERYTNKINIIENISKLIHNSTKLIFLGFSFNPTNMELFKSKDPNTNFNFPYCFITTYMLSEYNSIDISESLARLFNVSPIQLMSTPRIKYKSCTCTELFDEYSRGLYL